MIEHAALTIDGLTKSFATTPAVQTISLAVPAGSFFGLVGPNGAGKTTTLAMCTGLLRPDMGRIKVFGHDVWQDPVTAKTIFGVLPDGLTTIDRLSGRELLTFQGLLRGMDREVVNQRSTELLEALGLSDAENKLVADYSAGMTKKIGLACAMLHAPRLLLLDEPFEAVDPVSSATIRKILQRFVARGGSVVLSSHVMATVEQLCSHVAIMHRGSIAAAGPIADVRGDEPLEDVFVRLVGGQTNDGGELSWLR
ncbi:ABC transporter ATP-binding protein [Hoyosella rhizosphaerae]|uniref:ABC transporter ATP-binding protein n=1 Tax=Hoyosella rhizosphaerae TaxID=1755582 RepID=A0A916UAZ0_9ACTN|nr:ABC transporter ATP-binding protein [Hoyosella rhizosphaerae]MBN4925902.1 ABC transporter ATP-binding protein [Hoyosella rhizosphaerae]GGC67066.1 ABC transporter ATP-binding protein [Hoyosella rhizosphaerae]